jgi:isocitrate lyase
MIEAGAAGVQFSDQLSSRNKRRHTGGITIAPAGEIISTLVAGRLAADVLGVPTLLIARTDANRATLVRGDSDERDKPFLTGERTIEGDYVFRAYGCSPSFDWKAQFTRTGLERFQTQLAAMGYKFQFIAPEDSAAAPARDYQERGSLARPGLPEHQWEEPSEHAHRDAEHQRLRGTGDFDAVTQIIAGTASSETVPKGSIG